MSFKNYSLTATSWRPPVSLLLLLLGLCLPLPAFASGEGLPDDCTTEYVVSNICGPFALLNCPNDFDCDEIPDDQDLDDDNDGILDTDECSSNVAEAVFSVADGVTQTFNMPNASEGFTFDLYFLDNSFNFIINGTPLVPQQLEFSDPNAGAGDSPIRFASDNGFYGSGGIPVIWSFNNDGTNSWNDTEQAVVRLVIDGSGNVSFFGRRNANSLLEPLVIEAGAPGFNTVTWNTTGGNVVIINQDVVGNTELSGLGYGVGTDCNPVNTDGTDGTDDMDLDSDDDTCSDVTEAGYEDPDGDGMLGTSPLTLTNGGVDADGLVLNAGGYTGTTNAVTNDQICCMIGITSIAATDAGCGGGSNGTITVVGSGAASIDYTLAAADGTLLATNQTGIFNGLAAATYTVIVNDAADVTCLVEQTVEVKDDTEAPQANCSPSGFGIDITGPSFTFTAELLNDGSTDNCGTTNLSIEAGDQFVFTCADVGTSPTMTLIVDDGNGNSSSCDVTVNIEDGQAFCCAIDITSATPTPEGCPDAEDGEIDVIVSGATNVTYTLSLGGSQIAQNNTGDFTGLADGTYDILVSDDDRANCTATSTATVAAGTDTEAPTATCLPTLSVGLDANETASVTAAMIDDGSSDACGGVTVAITDGLATYDCSNFGQTNTVTLTVTDGAGLTATCTTDVTVTIGSASDFDTDGVPDCFDQDDDNDGILDINELECNTFTSTPSSSEVTIIEDFDAGPDPGAANPDVTNSYTYSGLGATPDGSYSIATDTDPYDDFGPGVLNVWAETHGVGDATGDVNGYFLLVNGSAPGQEAYRKTFNLVSNSSFTASIKVLNLGPSLEIKPNLTLRVESSSGALLDEVNTGDLTNDAWETYNFSGATGTDNQVDLVVISNSASGTGNDYGIDDVSITYTPLLCDRDEDDIPDSQELDADNDGCFDVAEAGYDDPDDDGILGNSPVTVDANGLVVGQGGYDGAFNEDATDPVITCPANIVEVATSASGAVVTFADATATDNCSASVAQTAGPVSGATFPIAETTVEFTATDAGGNTDVCSFTITVTGVVPDISCPGNITVDNDEGDCGAVVTFEATETTGSPITYSQDPGTSFPVGETTVVATATNSVDSDECSFTVTVNDTEAPTFACPGAQTFTLDLCDEYTLTEGDLGLSGTDNCGGTVTFSLSQTEFTAAGTFPVTVTATDENGNTSDGSCVVQVTMETNPESFVITTEDDDLGTSCPGAPVMITPADLLLNDEVTNNQTLEVQDVTLVNSSQGTIVSNANGTFTFNPAPGVTGSVALTYLVKTQGSELFFEGNGHYYEFVSAPGISWTAAKNAAENSTQFGQSGYLVTITSQAEQNFVRSRLQGFGWMGASDAASPDQWFWVTGPEAGTQFWSGRANGSRVNGQYENWHPQEPNNATVPGWSPSGEMYGHLRANGQWNDYPHTVGFLPGFPNERIDGYVIEYGGIGCQPSSTALGNITINLEDNEAPTASCAEPFTVDLVAGTTTITAAQLDNATTPSSDNCGNVTLSIEATDQVTFTCADVSATPKVITLVVEDDNGQTAQCDVDVTIADGNSNCCDIAITEATSTRVVCVDDGTITVTATCASCDNGAADIRYSTDGTNFQVSNVLEDLPAGDYTVTVQDVNSPSCTATIDISVGECVGEIPGNGQDDDCNPATEDMGTVAWVLLDAGTNNACVSNTDCCAEIFCYGLEYTPGVSGILTTYTTAFTSDCIDGNTPLISNSSCVLLDNSFDAADCAGGNGIFFNSSAAGQIDVANPVQLMKNVPIILHQICLSIPDEQTIDLEVDDITGITMSIDVPGLSSDDPVIQATDNPDYVTATAAGNMRPEVTQGTIDDCYATLAEAEQAALDATSATDDCTSVSAPSLMASTSGTCSAVITVTATDQCGLTTEVTYNTRIDGDGATITGTLDPIEEEACAATDIPAASTVAELEALGADGFDITDNCTPDADLVVTFEDVSVGSCPITVTRTYTITDECGRTSTVEQTLTLNDTTSPTVSGALTTPTVDGCDANDAPDAATTVAELEALDGNLSIVDACTADAAMTVTHTESINDACPRVLTRIYTVSDACGNPSQVIHQINIQDITMPSATGALTPITVEGCDASDAPDPVTTIADLEALEGDLDVMDNCTDDVDLMIMASDSDVAGSCPTKTVVTRTYTITDRCNNSFTVTRMITIEDTTMPEVTGSLTAVDAEGCDASAAPDPVITVAALELLAGDLQISDACTADESLVVNSSDASEAGTCPNVLVITRTYTVTDACSNVATLTQTINITDTTAPEVTGAPTTTTVEGCDESAAPAAVTTIADLEALGTGFDIEDACTDDVSLNLSHNDVSVAGTCPNILVITRTYTISDACGNEETVDHIINIEDTTAPDVTATPGDLEACYADRAVAEAAALAATAATDLCDDDVELTVTSTGQCPATITVTATDDCDNADFVQYTVVITDGAAATEVGGPVAISADIQTTLDDVEPTPPTFQDVCGNVLTPSAAVKGGTYVEGECTGTITYTFTFTDCAGTETDWVFTYNVDCQGLKLKVFLEGGFNTTTQMLSTEINDKYLLPGQDKNLNLDLFFAFQAVETPFGHPYGAAPWNYTGTTGAGFGDASRGDAPAGVQAYPNHVADWVLVTVRMDALDAPDFWQCAGWLHENGEVTFPEACPITLDAGATYFVMIEHRKHLPILAQASVVDNGGGDVYLNKDFTLEDSYAPIFRFGQKELLPGVFGMFAGNANQGNSRSSINSSDRTDWRIDQGKIGYFYGDFDQSAVTTSGDETLWKNNQNKSSGINFNN